MLVLAGGAGGAMLFTIIYALIVFLSSRGVFMLLDGVASGQATVKRSWREQAGAANSLFGFRMIAWAVTVGLTLLTLGGAGLMGWEDFRRGSFGLRGVWAVTMGLPTLAMWWMGYATAIALLKDFIAATMYHRGVGVQAAWGVFWREVARGRMWPLTLFYLMRLLLGIGVAMLAAMVMCATCCMGALPYIRDVMLLPVWVLLRAYSLYFLAQIGPEWQMLTPLAGEPPRCPACGYDMRGNPKAPTCPECGVMLAPDGVVTAAPRLASARGKADVMAMDDPTLRLGRGVNISHWLSQSDHRGAERRAWFTAADVHRIADWGFSHIRLPIDEQQLWDDRGDVEGEAWDLLGAGLDWARAAGLRAVVDLHILRSHHFNQADEPALYRDEDEAKRFAHLWRDLSAFLRAWPEDVVAYELLNEPVARDPADWNRVAALALAAVREGEPTRKVILGSNRFQSCDTFADLAVPEDPHVILSCHFYDPVLITHHRAPWSPAGVYRGPVQYPGLIVSEEAMAQIEDESVRQVVGPRNGIWNRERIRQQIAKPVEVARRHGKALYCGEFGCYHALPRVSRVAWYRDVAAVLGDFGIPWANWDYRGGFGLLTQAGEDQPVLDILRGMGGESRVSV